MCSDKTEYIRIDIVRPKKEIPESIHHQLVMPNGLGQFTNLARNDSMINRGYINKELWDIKKTVWLKLVQLMPATLTSTATIGVRVAAGVGTGVGSEIDGAGVGGTVGTGDGVVV